jgi:hypothetical protein
MSSRWLFRGTEARPCGGERRSSEPTTIASASDGHDAPCLALTGSDDDIGITSRQVTPVQQSFDDTPSLRGNARIRIFCSPSGVKRMTEPARISLITIPGRSMLKYGIAFHSM